MRANRSISLARLAVLLTTIAGCVGCDQLTKSAARVQLDPGVTISVFRDIVRLQHVENAGAFLSMGDALPSAVRAILFTFGGALLVVGAIIWTLRSQRLHTAQTIAAALICGGGLGNLIDRLCHHGYVTDFLNVGIGPLRTGIFNVADFALLLGAGMIAWVGVGDPRPSRPRREDS
jgi:signal peptidase II